MNLGFVVRRFATDGGTERYTVELSKWLAGRGHAVHVYCAEAVATVPGVQVHKVLGRGRGLSGLLGDLRVVRRIPDDRHQLVQAFIRVPGLAVYRAGGGAHLAWLQARSPAWRRGPRDWLELWADRRTVADARVVICNSEMAAEDLRRLYGRRAVKVARNGVDAEHFRPDPVRRERAREAWRVPADGRVALFLGNGYRRKGLSTAAAAFLRVACPSDRFVVAGHDAHAARAHRRLRSALGDRLVVCGPLASPERWLPGADATLLPTRYDPAANTTLEAMACAVPPVTSSRDGNAEIVPDPNLVVADPTDEAGFSVALLHAWNRADGDVFRKTALSWPVSRNAEQVEAIYRELVHG